MSSNRHLMMKRMKYRLLGLLLAVAGGSSQMLAQTNGEFNPANPADPQLPVFKEYRPVTVSIIPTDAGSVSRSGSSSKNGKFEVGTTVWISMSSYSDFTFKHWLKNGEVYAAAGTSTYFDYTVEDCGAEFVAVYEYNPSSPVDPSGQVKSKLHLKCEPAEACSFTLTSGMAYQMDTYVKLGVNPNQDYEFIGWYNGSELVSNIASVNYLMPYHDVTLTARFRYTWVFNPEDPADPESQGGNIQTEELLIQGDIDEDGVVDAADIMLLINSYLSAKTNELDKRICDLNNDNVIDAADIMLLINRYLNNQYPSGNNTNNSNNNIDNPGGIMDGGRDEI